MKAVFSRFLKHENGAVTVDWILLCAGIVSLGLSTMALVGASADDLSGQTATNIANRLDG